MSATRPIIPHSLEKRDDYQSRFNFRVEREIGNVGTDLRKMSDGRLAGFVSAPAAPTGGSYALGDTVRNSAPAVAGGAGSQYVIVGWICTVAGNPGTWVEMRTLTGT